MSPIDDNQGLELVYGDDFLTWRSKLRDLRALARIASRLDRLSEGDWGDTKGVGGGVIELRLHFGPGYRVYVKQQGRRIVVLLCGGDKSSQSRDIALAQTLAAEITDAS